jgi:hypothetical protein
VRRRPSLLTLIVALLGFTAGAGGQTPFRPPAGWEATVAKLARDVARKDGFFEVRSKNYRARSDVDARFTAELGAYMDLVHKAYTEVFAGESKVKLIPTVTVLAEVEAYRRETGSRNTRGIFLWDFDKDDPAKPVVRLDLYSYVEKPAERKFAAFPLDVLRHEGTHQLIQSRAGSVHVPLWFHEGFAGTMEHWDVAGGGKENIAAIAAARRSADITAKLFRDRGRPRLLKELIGLKGVFDKGDEFELAAGYLHAEAFFVYLLGDPKRRATLNEAYKLMIAGKPAEGLLFEGARGAEMETAFLKWLRKE